jgi:acetyl-CoA carboxylase biotin carboxylase subunit
VGFPLLVKASAGGGGRGIRQVDSIDELEEAMIASGSEAANTFGDATIFLERYVSPARHIEVQVMADSHGNVRTYGERECSVQRRHQKVLEEAPSVAVDPELRARISEAAAAAARSCGYRNAGTVEFLMDASGEFYFLEMNARLQVEHPVTELVYGVDLVAQQLAVAAGAELDPGDAPPEPRGWAIEARINGEDPYNNFTPSLGLVDHVDIPQGPGVRFDTMLFDGLDVPIYYDSMLGKLIVWAESREAAIDRLRRALKDLVISGIETNVPFHLELLDNPDFVTGDIDTGWLEREFTMPVAPEDDRRIEAALIAGGIAASLVAGASRNGASAGSMTKWVSAARAASKRGVRVEGGVHGWRRGIGSE